jgi:cobalt-zinc-cadmium efflux system outer membrane protein
LTNRIEVRQARQVVEQTRAVLRLQTAAARPDVEVLSGYKRTSGFNTLLWGFQVNLPFFNKNHGNIAAASSEITVAESRLKSVEAHVRADVEAALRDVQSRRQRLASLVSGTLNRADDSVAIARAAYREGGTDLPLLDAERMHIELEVMNARMRMEYRQSLVALETALGVSR